MWQLPRVNRHGRSGQRQEGVDIYARPKHLGKSYAGVQCKRVVELTEAMVKEEVGKAGEFEPTLAEYIIMTTAPRDANLQRKLRTEDWPFDLDVMFWEDISLELSGYNDLLQKHFPGWAKTTTTHEQVLSMVMDADPADFKYDDHRGTYLFTQDTNLILALDRSFNEGDPMARRFEEPWVEAYPDSRATIQPIHIVYNGNVVEEYFCACVDGGRHLVPYPKSSSDLTITPFQYQLGLILNRSLPSYASRYGGNGSAFDFALTRAGIRVQEPQKIENNIPTNKPKLDIGEPGEPLQIRMDPFSDGTFNLKYLKPHGTLDDIEPGTALVATVSGWRSVAVMVNERDHVRMFVLVPGPDEEDVSYEGFFVRGRFTIQKEISGKHEVHEAWERFIPR